MQSIQALHYAVEQRDLPPRTKANAAPSPWPSPGGGEGMPTVHRSLGRRAQSEERSEARVNPRADCLFPFGE
jgi:hypothetical protein